MKKISYFLIFLMPFLVFGQEFDLFIKERTHQLYDEAVRLRRELHKFPELCFKEEKTAIFIINYLKKLKLEIKTNIAKTGIKAILKGCREKPVVGIRSDMDALPILENTNLKFSSKNKGIMHACGHDAHMANVLITAKILSELRDRIPGTIVFIFQPCEEGTGSDNPSGASQMISEGVLENPSIDYMLGLHVMPGSPAGTVGFREGPIMANVASLYIKIIGQASHGAMPHQGIDAIYAASNAVMQFQSLISRYRDPNQRAVLTIGTMNGGVRFNVIAESVSMRGTVRTFSEKTEDKIENGIKNILDGLKISTGITYEYRFARGSKFVKNDIAITGMMTPLFKEILGKENVYLIDPVTIGEDFSAYSHRIPSFFFLLGAGMGTSLHHPKFTVDEKIFLYGPRLFANAAIEILKKAKSE